MPENIMVVLSLAVSVAPSGGTDMSVYVYIHIYIYMVARSKDFGYYWVKLGPETLQLSLDVSSATVAI